MKFAVPKAWFASNNADSNAVYLQRFESTEGVKLPTTKVSETSDSIVYEADSPGFSYFAVTAASSGASTYVPTSENSEVSVTGNGNTNEANTAATGAANGITGAVVGAANGTGSSLWLGIVLIAAVAAIVGVIVYGRYKRRK